VVILQDGINDCPGGFNRVLTREECSVANHGVAQEPLIRSLLARLFFAEVKLSLFSNEILPRDLHASSKSNGRVWRQPKAQIIGWACR